MADKFEGNIAAQAWAATKADGDPEYRGSSEVEFWNELDYRAQKVQETGTAITNFEKEVQKLDAKDKQKQAAIGGPMAVVEEPAAITVGASAGLTKTPAVKELSDSEKAAVKKEHEAKKQPDSSGHVPTTQEKVAAAKEGAKAPKHP